MQSPLACPLLMLQGVPGAVTVDVNEPIGGTWRMLQASHAWTKTDAWAARFPVTVAADSVAVLTYRVRVTY